MDLMLAGLLASVCLLLPATFLVFTVRPHARPRVTGALRATGAAVLVGLAALPVLALAGWPAMPAAAVGAALAGSVLLWEPVTRGWATRGLVGWALTIDAGVLYLAYVLLWTLTAGLGPASLIASLALWLLELFVFFIGIGYLWEFVDVLTRRNWSRSSGAATLADGQDAEAAPRPFVSLHVPTHNEPPDMVIATLTRLLEQEYDDYEILLVDNNTTDPDLWRPVERFCATQERITFIHLEDWPGYKSGALNYALTRTDARAAVIGIIDADYLVEPGFLADCAPLFGDPGVDFVQTPQDYRGWEQAPYFRRLYYSYGYFFDVSQKSRNERNAAIFGGTMGLIRRSALVDSGGWDEWCITEDAELSLRLLKRGGSGLHVDRSYGYGVMPLTFEALKRQRFRWCFGGIQILRMHWRALLPGRRTPDNQLTGAQRWGYLVGGLQWFGDLAALLFTAFLLVGATDALLGGGLVLRRLSGFLMLGVVVLVVLGIVRSLALVRRTSGANWGEALGAFGLWTALGPTVAQACTRGLVARVGVFLRTPKVRGELRARHALLGNVVETGLALVCALVALTAVVAQPSPATGLLAGLLLLQAAGYASAPINSLAAIRSDLPPELRRRRRLMLVSWGKPARRGGLLLGGAVAGLAAIVLSAAPVSTPSLDGIPQAPSSADADEEDDDEPGTAPVSPTEGGTTSGGPGPTGPATAGAGADGNPTRDAATVGAGITSTPPAGSTQQSDAPTGGAASTAPSPSAPAPTEAQPTRRPSTAPSQAAPTQAAPTQAAPSTKPTAIPSGRP